MAYSLTITPATAITPISSKSKKSTRQHLPSIGFQRVSASNEGSKLISSDNKLIDRRLAVLLLDRMSVSFGFASAVLGMNIDGGRSALAARKPPPPPLEERKDPNVSGVQAKVLASKKRKEAMKEAVAKLREKGKSIGGPSKAKPTNEPPE